MLRNTAFRATGDSESPESARCARSRPGGFCLPVFRRCGRFERLEKATRDGRYFVDRYVEGGLVGLGGVLKPLIFRTNCSDAARISSPVAGGSKLYSVLMFLHIFGPQGRIPVTRSVGPCARRDAHRGYTTLLAAYTCNS
jgi:hypothetical protein